MAMVSSPSNSRLSCSINIRLMLFMGGVFDQAVFQGVGKGSVPDIMQQDGYGHRLWPPPQ